MESLYIIGSGGFAKEVFGLIIDINKKNNLYKVEGFIDIRPQSTSIVIGNDKIPVYDEAKWLRDNKSSTNINLALGVGVPKISSKIIERFSKYNFPNLIHPSATINQELNQFGVGNIITAGVVFTLQITVGSYNIFNLNTTIGHEAHVGNCNVFNPSVNISGGVNIRDNNLFGVGSIILQFLKIGSNSILGAGALLSKDLESNKLAVGIPAKVIKDLL